MTNSQKIKKDRSHYFDRFIMAGLLMNVLDVVVLVSFWLFKHFT